MLTTSNISLEKAMLHAEQKVQLKAIALDPTMGLRELVLLTSKSSAKPSPYVGCCFCLFSCLT